ncbi:MAG: hypothetical protein CMJ58_27145 [Planctomycetaceae bacterium]|nr:hypothetical protein [Planctomycetaceae bacterium]
MSIPKPNLFLIGAPKCGTTSLAWYLSEHPAVFFCDPKEPFYFNTDYPELRRKEHLETDEAYLQLFAAARPEHAVIAEGSTTYLSSAEAIANALAFSPEARFIAMVRNPVDAVYSFHGELVFTSNEDVRDFEQAWRLQAERAAGRSLPELCRNPAWLQYRQMGALGSQLQRFYDQVPAAQRMTIVFDEYAADTPGYYRRVLEFLGLPDDGRIEFPRLKASRRHRLEFVHRFLRMPPRAIEAPVIRLRRWIGRQRTGPIAAVKNVFMPPHKRAALTPEFAAELRREFADEVALLSELLGRDLSDWNTGGQAA